MRCVRQRMLSISAFKILNIFCLCVCLFHDHDLVRGLEVGLTNSQVSSLISRLLTLSLRHSPMTGSCFVITLLMIIFPDWRMVGRSSIDHTHTECLKDNYGCDIVTLLIISSHLITPLQRVELNSYSNIAKLKFGLVAKS